MKRISMLAAVLIVPMLLTGCEEDDIAGLEDCEDLAGNFRATDFGFADANRSLIRDFGQEGTTFDVRLNANGTFESAFTERNQAAFTRTGTFQASRNQLLLGNQNLFPEADVGEQRFVCQRLADNRFRLRSAAATRFDFNRNNTFDAGEQGFFEGDFETF
jgi:hypothetical protein